MPRPVPRKALASFGAWLLIVVPQTLADVRTSPHNLARGGPAAEDDELCIFCHTPAAPHGAVPPPRWQLDLPETFQYAIYDDIGVGDLSAGRVGSHSVVCLSCHDASQAPNAGPVSIAPGISPDHPIGVPYRGAAGDMGPFAEYKVASSATINGRRVWWVSRHGPEAARSRTDLPFFSTVLAGSPEPVPLIECGTCHDPHGGNRQFLRVPPSQGGLCFTCHAK
jgi:predicted CXXCH cytochrome family protein